VSRCGRTRLRVFIRRRMRCGMSLARGLGWGRARSRALSGSRSMFLRVGSCGVRRLGLRLSPAGRRVSRRCLPQSRLRRCASTHHHESAACAHPSSYSRAMFPVRFQRQPLEDQWPVIGGQ
jgi:hypothetical protein